MPAERMKVGNAEIVALWECTLDNKGPEFFKWAPPEAQKQHPEIFTPGAILHHNVCSYLVLSQGKRVLVDTGVGPGPFPNGVGAPVYGRLLEALKGVGLSPADIDYVFTTHIHGDHLGWNLTKRGRKYEVTFPNARYIFPKADWEHFRSPEAQRRYDYVKEFVLPFEKLLDHVDLVEGKYRLSDELRAYPTPGHTPGHQSLLVASQGKRALVVGDAVHERAQLQYTDWQSNADSQGEVAVESRKKLVDWLVKEGVMCAVIHYPHPGFGRVAIGEGRRYWEPL